MNESLLNTKWWIGISTQSELDRAIFMCRVFGIPVWADSINDQSYTLLDTYMPGFHYDAIRVEQGGDEEYVGACQCMGKSEQWREEGYHVFHDLDSLYKFLEDLRDSGEQ